MGTIRIPRKPRVMRERDEVQKPVVQFLEIDGWRCFRTELTVQKDRGRVVGELGQPDYLAIRYHPESVRLHYRTVAEAARTEVMWLEMKAPNGARLSANQKLWHAAERKRGALVLVVDNFDAFRAWYMDSGLNRRIKA